MTLLKGDLKNQLLWYRRAQGGLLALLLLVTGLAYTFWIQPANVALESARVRAIAARTELQDDQMRSKNLPLVQREIDHLRQRVDRFDKKLPRQPDLDQFMSDVAHISQDASLRKLSWRLESKPRNSDHLTELPIQLTFEGDFQTGLVQFLKGTEEMPRLMRVRKLDIKAGDLHDGQVKAELTMNIYFGEQ